MKTPLTARQRSPLRNATGIHEASRGIDLATGHDPITESGRFEARELIAAI